MGDRGQVVSAPVSAPIAVGQGFLMLGVLHRVTALTAAVVTVARADGELIPFHGATKSYPRDTFSTRTKMSG